MAIRIIKPPPPAREFHIYCDGCQAEVGFLKEDCKPAADPRETLVSIECPHCHRENIRTQDVFW